LKLVQVLATPRSIASDLIHVEFETREFGALVDRETIIGTAEHPVFVVGRGMEQGGGKFVPLGEIDVGDEVVLASGELATVFRVVRQQVCDGEEFGFAQTYNLDVGGANTYFVGRSGLWVHNAASGRCKTLFSILEWLLDANTPLPDARGRVNLYPMVNHPAFASEDIADKRQIALHLQNKALAKSIETGSVDVSKCYSYNELKEIRRTNGFGSPPDRLGDRDLLEVNHGAPRFWIGKILSKRDPSLGEITRTTPNALLDGGVLAPGRFAIPNFFMPRSRHKLGNIDTPDDVTFHGILAKYLYQDFDKAELVSRTSFSLR
jgi:hypothetical protein